MLTIAESERAKESKDAVKQIIRQIRERPKS
jgi:hypothetical protein